MIKLNEVIIVEGKYDKKKLASFIDAQIIATNGFRIFKDRQKVDMIKKLSEKYGVLIITDSDSAGFMIRNYIKKIVPSDKIINVYVPQIKGREKRKDSDSKEGLLGVEGLSEDIIIKALENSGVSVLLNHKPKEKVFSVQMLFDDGLVGKENSKYLRKQLLFELNLPNYLSTKALIEYLNYNFTVEQYNQILQKLNNK